MKTILVSVDLSAATVRVCAAAADLARAMDARLVILHAVPPLPTLPYGIDSFSAAYVVEFNRTARKAAAHKLQALQHWFNKRSPGTKMALHEGQPADIILRSARRVRADYIVLGSHGHGAMYDLVAGSTARGIIRMAPCPVVLVPVTKQTGKHFRKSARPSLEVRSAAYD